MESMEGGAFGQVMAATFFWAVLKLRICPWKQTSFSPNMAWQTWQPVQKAKLSDDFFSMDAPMQSCFKDWLAVIGTIARMDITPRKTNIANPKMEVDGRCFSFSNGVILQLNQSFVFGGTCTFYHFLNLKKTVSNKTLHHPILIHPLKLNIPEAYRVTVDGRNPAAPNMYETL